MGSIPLWPVTCLGRGSRQSDPAFPSPTTAFDPKTGMATVWAPPGTHRAGFPRGQRDCLTPGSHQRCCLCSYDSISSSVCSQQPPAISACAPSSPDFRYSPEIPEPSREAGLQVTLTCLARAPSKPQGEWNGESSRMHRVIG